MGFSKKKLTHSIIKMNYLLIFILILIVVLITTNHENFVERFGFSGYTEPVSPVKLNDPRPDLSKFTEVEAGLDPDLMQELVLQANKEINKRTNLCSYIIETTKVKQYRNDEDNVDIYECQFMNVKTNGFSYGFSTVATYEKTGNKIRLVSLRSQPLGTSIPSDVSAYVGDKSNKEFIDYELVKEHAVPKKSELDEAKNKLQLI